jgi:diaminopimelate epimerase
MHGLGNDFVIIDACESPVSLDTATIRAWADRRRGIGFDQLLEISPGRQTRYAYRVFNADGGEVEQCGNGVRCVARWLHDRQRETERFVLESKAGPIEVAVLNDNQVRVNMGLPRFAPTQIPADYPARKQRYPLTVDGEELSLGLVSMGNPHAVIQCDDIDTTAVNTLGPAIQRSPAFPEGVNVGFMQVVDSGRIRLRVFERGTGETRACGTGACAAAVIGRSWGLLDPGVDVELPGGTLTIHWHDEASAVTMTGPASYAFEGKINS